MAPRRPSQRATCPHQEPHPPFQRRHLPREPVVGLLAKGLATPPCLPPPPGPLSREARLPEGSIKWVAGSFPPPLLTRVLQVAPGAPNGRRGPSSPLGRRPAGHSFSLVAKDAPAPPRPAHGSADFRRQGVHPSQTLPQAPPRSARCPRPRARGRLAAGLVRGLHPRLSRRDTQPRCEFPTPPARMCGRGGRGGRHNPPGRRPVQPGLEQPPPGSQRPRPRPAAPECPERGRFFVRRGDAARAWGRGAGPRGGPRGRGAGPRGPKALPVQAVAPPDLARR